MGEWTIKKLGDVVELRRGFDLPGRERRDGPFPVLSAGVTAGWHDEAPIKGPGFVVGRATNLGVPTWSEGDFWPLNTTLYAADFKGNDPRFLFRLFQVLDLSGFDSGSVQPMLNRNYIADVDVLVPDLSVQYAIAEVLGALDDKIAANAQTVRLLLDLADAHFAYAVREAQVGSASFNDLALVGGGGTPRTSVEEYWGGDLSWATPTDVTALSAPYLERTSRTISEDGLAACASVLYPVGSILMTSRATIGAFAVAQVPTAVNQGFIVVNAKNPRLRWWLFHEMKSRVPEFLSFANGATFLELPRGHFRDLGVRLASDGDMERFAGLVEPIHAMAATLSRESGKLAATRDELLPLLMSGRICVKDAATAVGEVL